MAVPQLQMLDLPPTHRERLIDFLSENNVHVSSTSACRLLWKALAAPAISHLEALQFYEDVDGNYVANVRMYDPAVMEEMGINPNSKDGSSPKSKNKVRYRAATSACA